MLHMQKGMLLSPFQQWPSSSHRRAKERRFFVYAKAGNADRFV